MGRKRHILVDTLGLIMLVMVHSADIQDRVGARLVLAKLKGAFGSLKLIWVDGGYSGKLQEWLAALLPWRSIRIEVVKRSQLHTFKILPKRWIVERSFAWLGFYRRLSKDYEARLDHSEAMILLASSRQMLKRLSN